MNKVTTIFKTITTIIGLFSCLFFSAIALYFISQGYRPGDCVTIPVVGIEIPLCRPDASATHPEEPTQIAPVVNTANPSILPTDTVQPANIAPTAISNHLCVPTQYQDLGNSWTVGLFPPTTQGSVTIFSHCPPSNTIQYNEFAVDDKLIKVEKVCSDSTTDITNMFTEFTVQGELLPHYKSELIDVGADCRVNFHAQDIYGGNSGVIIMSAQPSVEIQAPENVNVFDNSVGRVYILGYTSENIEYQTMMKECNNCPAVYITSLNELPDDWYHYSFHVGSPTDHFPDGCRTKQDLINLGVTRVMMTNWTSCP